MFCYIIQQIGQPNISHDKYTNLCAGGRRGGWVGFGAAGALILHPLQSISGSHVWHAQNSIYLLKLLHLQVIRILVLTQDKKSSTQDSLISVFMGNCDIS